MLDRAYIGVDAIIFNEDSSKVLLMRRTGKTYNGMWGLISGFVESGETIKDALMRESMEEIGIEINIHSYTGRYYDTIGRHPTKTVICLPHICSIKSGVPLPVSECDQIDWFLPEDLKGIDMAFDHKKMLLDIGFLKTID